MSRQWKDSNQQQKQGKGSCMQRQAATSCAFKDRLMEVTHLLLLAQSTTLARLGRLTEAAGLCSGRSHQPQEASSVQRCIAACGK